MTDKVQKIREEVKKLMYGFNLEADIASCEDTETEKLADIKYQLCKKILDYIDNVQKEHIFKVGDTIQKKDDNSIRYSIINKTSDWYRGLRGLSDTIVIWLSEQDQWELVEEPVSDDLVEAAITAADEDMQGRQIMEESNENRQLYSRIFRRGFKAGAKWQQEKDKKWLADNHKQIFNNGWAEGFEDGRDDAYIDLLQEEPISDDLEEAAKYYIPDESYHMTIESKEEGSGENVYDYVQMIEMFKAGAKWQKQHLWKPADGDNLPEIDREVIALIDNSKVVFAHRPDPKGWDAKSIITEKVEHYIPKTYDKGGWNIPDVKYWLDVELPKEIEL